MTKLLPQDRLRLIATVMEHPTLQTRRQVPILQWAVDAKTGRPVSDWVLADASGRPAFD